jgi:hypothetical protein
MYDDLIRRLMDLSSEENIFVSQPCRDNTLYLLRLVDEMLISDIDLKLPVYNFQDFMTRFMLNEFLSSLLKEKKKKRKNPKIILKNHIKHSFASDLILYLHFFS